MKQLVNLWLRRKRKGQFVYCLRWFDGNKRRCLSLGHTDKRRAEKQRLEKEIELRGNKPELTDLRLSELLEVYLEHNKRIESSTVEMARRNFKNLMNYTGNIKAGSLEYRHCESYQAACLNSGLSPTTVNIRIATVKPVFRWAVKRRMLYEDPWQYVKQLKVPKKLIRILENDEFQRILENAPSLMWRARLLLAKTAGLRRGEVLNLTVKDVDFNHGVVCVQPKKETEFTWRWQVKDKDVREVPLIEELAKLLVQLQVELPEGQPYLLIPPQRYQRLIELKERGKLLDWVRRDPDNNFSRSIGSLFHKSEVRDATFHDLRRTCITEWLENGLHPHEVMRLAGHSNISTTMKYYVGVRRDLVDRARIASEAGMNMKSDALLTRAADFAITKAEEGFQNAS